ncbi:MAG: uracil-DNA glycosylase [Alphaproteobacteria bacterium]|jgi:uracil-DNA glycosylase|tara:strand:+ start:3111 stop:3791 length:681 start_codon:yes stop_codon:yes gene_type:complete
MESNPFQLPSSWIQYLEEELNQSYMKDLKKKLIEYQNKNITVYPEKSKIFNAFHLTPFQKIKVVILGQDPYHGPGQAHGLSFSVPHNIKTPPSLMNIFKELDSDLKVEINKTNGNLEHWAKQGVFLLNTTLTVEKSKPMSHKNFGWNIFTDKVIEIINHYRENIVFILWGAHAHSKTHLIDSSKHLILKSVHPSPLSSHRGFFGSRPFSQTNNYLESKEIDKIVWI